MSEALDISKQTEARKKYMRKWNREYRKKHGKKLKAYMKAYLKTYRVEYNKKHKKEAKEYAQMYYKSKQKKYRRIHRKELNKRRNIWVKNHIDKSFRNFLSECCHSASKSKKEFDLDLEFLLDLLKKQQYRCALTKIKLAHQRCNPCSVSIDRIDSTKGYLRNNVQLVCIFINRAKSNYFQQQMKQLIKEIKTGCLNETETKSYEKEYYNKQREKQLSNKRRNMWYRKHVDKSFRNYLMKCCMAASKSKKEFDLDLEFLLDLLEKQNYRCALTKIRLAHQRYNPRSVSIDRIDSTKGYLKDNVQLVCIFINRAKNDYSQEEVKQTIEEIKVGDLG